MIRIKLFLHFPCIGAFEVTILIFSGRRDPHWFIAPDHPLYNTIDELFTDAKRNNLTKCFDDVPSRLGFKGFLIQEFSQMLPSSSLVFNAETKELQKYLLETAPESEIGQSLKEKILKWIDDENCYLH